MRKVQNFTVQHEKAQSPLVIGLDYNARKAEKLVGGERMQRMVERTTAFWFLLELTNTQLVSLSLSLSLCFLGGGGGDVEEEEHL